MICGGARAVGETDFALYRGPRGVRSRLRDSVRDNATIPFVLIEAGTPELVVVGPVGTWEVGDGVGRPHRSLTHLVYGDVLVEAIPD